MATISRTDPTRTLDELRYSTGIDNLDLILGGGLRSFGEYSPCVVIKGNPGCGKSILAATMAAEFFKYDYSVAYFSLDQTASEMSATIEPFEWAPFSGAIIAPDEPDFFREDDPDMERELDRDGAKILLSHFPVNMLKASDCADYPHDHNRLMDWDARLNKHIRRRVSQLDHCRLIVVDALSDIFQGGSSEEDRRLFHIRRGMFYRICTLGRTLDAVMVIILEKRNCQDWREYVADIVIDLGWRERDGGDIERYLQVEKARYTEIIQGRHEIRIVDKKGIVVFPSHLESLRVYGPGVKTVKPVKDDFCGNEGLRRLFRGEGIIKGSASLIFGPDCNRKNVLAAQFIQQGLRDAEARGETNPRALFLAAGLTEEVTRDMLGRYFASEGEGKEWIDARLNQIDIICTDWSQSRDELFDRVRKILDKNNIVRAAVDDVSAFATNSDEVLPIRELFVQRGISSIFVQTTNPHEESAIRQCFDTILRSTNLILDNGLRRIGYRVLKLNGSMRTMENSWDLCFNEKTRGLIIEPSYQEYDESEKGHLRPSTLRLTTHCEYETTSRQEWDRLVRAAFGVSGTGKSSAVTVDTFPRIEAEKLFQEILVRHASQLPEETQVFAFDEYWFDELLQHDLLEPLDEYFSEEELSQHNHLSLARCRGMCIHDKSAADKPLFALPQYLNFGFYAIRRDLIDDEMLARHAIRLDCHEPWYKWLDLAREGRKAFAPKKARELIAKYGDDTSKIESTTIRVQPATYGCSKMFDEDLVCSILEVIWPVLFRGGEYQRFADEGVVEALTYWYSLLKKADALPLFERDQPQEPAVVQRYWVVSYWKMLEEHPKLADKLQIIHSPTLDVPGHGNDYQTTSIAGEWFLGVLRGSPNLHRGASAIHALANRSMNRVVLDRRIGLPSHRSMIVGDEAQQMADIYKNTVSRRQIRNYYDVRTVLKKGFEKIFGSPDLTPEGIRKILSKVDHQVRVAQGSDA